MNWTSRTPAANNDWLEVAWGGPAGQEKFVAVAVSGSSDRVMTSPDGINWTARTSASNNNWLSVIWGGPAGQEKFVAVAGDGGAAGSGNRVMTSPDGINWTLRTSPIDNAWWGVTWGGPPGQEKFVAVSSTGSGNRVMTSPDGITWSLQASASDSEWRSVVWGGPAGQEKFVAVATSGQVMTSPDGITWTSRTSAASNQWWEVRWGGPAGQEKFVAVSSTGSGNRVMTSPDGITWTSRTSAADNSWLSVAWGDPPGAIPGQFVAVSSTGSGNRVMTSPDGITWTSQTSAGDKTWRSVVWGGPAGQEKFVAVSQRTGSPFSSLVMTSQTEITFSCSSISGATNSTYTLAPADYQAYIQVEVTASNGVSPDGVASSPSSAQVAGQPPVNAAAPTISGTAQIGQTLTAGNGTWTGYPVPTLSHQWKLCDAGGVNCQNIAGATSSSYTLTSTDRDGTIRVEVNATNAVGSASASSDPTSAVEPTPAPPPPPTPSGKPKLRVEVRSPRRVEAGRGFGMEIEVANSATEPTATRKTAVRADPTTAKSIRACVRLPRGVVLVGKGSRGKVDGKALCWTRRSLAAGETFSRGFRARTVRGMSGPATFRVTVTATNADGATSSTGSTDRLEVSPAKRPEPRPPTG
ncbi:MAG: arabinan endo-1,5-alpha-L-arabinosidase [Solirubrobacterales bacterium]|nr:arabinan endo-1,5-alpha-L-arabinosidase [Solirubrobacterales bacterium]